MKTWKYLSLILLGGMIIALIVVFLLDFLPFGLQILFAFIAGAFWGWCLFKIAYSQGLRKTKMRSTLPTTIWRHSFCWHHFETYAGGVGHTLSEIGEEAKISEDTLRKLYTDWQKRGGEVTPHFYLMKCRHCGKLQLSGIHYL